MTRDQSRHTGLKNLPIALITMEIEERASVSAHCKTKKEEYLLSTDEMREWVRVHEEPLPEAYAKRNPEPSCEYQVKSRRPACELHSDCDKRFDTGICSLCTADHLVDRSEEHEYLEENNSRASQPGCCDQIPALVAGVRDLVTALSTNPSATTTAISSQTLGVREAARGMGCSAKTIHKLCHEKRLAFHWVGNKRRFRPEDISRFFETQTEITKTQGPSGVDETRVSRLRFSGSFTAGRPKKGGEKGSTKGTNNGTETEILASIRERMREWD